MLLRVAEVAGGSRGKELNTLMFVDDLAPTMQSVGGSNFGSVLAYLHG